VLCYIHSHSHRLIALIISFVHLINESMIMGLWTIEVMSTSAGTLPCRHIIHTVGPVYYDGNRGEAIVLQMAMRNTLELADTLKCKSLCSRANEPTHAACERVVDCFLIFNASGCV
jgi:hypothetical protein